MHDCTNIYHTISCSVKIISSEVQAAHVFKWWNESIEILAISLKITVQSLYSKSLKLHELS